MASSTAVGYVNDAGEFRATTINIAEIPAHSVDPYAIANALNMLANGDQDFIEDWIEAGIAHDGYDVIKGKFILGEERNMVLIDANNYVDHDLTFMFIMEDDGVSAFYDPKNALNQDPDWLR